MPFTNQVIRRPCETCAAEAKLAAAEAEVAAERQRQERERLERIELSEQRAANVEMLLARMGVTRKYLQATLGDFDPEPDRIARLRAQEVVGGFLNGDRPSLYLHSHRPDDRIACGAGKTHLAVGILRALILDPRVALPDLGFAFVPRLLLELQATFKNPDKSELEVVEKYSAPELLVWDDFGAEKLGEYSGRALYTILYEREGKSNIFTSNLSLDEVESRDVSGYGARITSRIAGDARVICLSGPDRRVKSA